ncbi:MAG: mechanosensitive ion channel family protein [Anaeroplasmataceae bacterium]
MILTFAETMAKWGNVILEWLKTSGIKLLIALIILIIAFKLIDLVFRLIEKKLLKRKIDKSAVFFIKTLSKILLKVLVFISLLSFVGFEVAGLAAMLAAMGVAVGLALQGSLSNLAGGIIILLMKPFRSGDVIETSTHKGTVEQINLFYTYLITADNRSITVPNAVLSNNAIVNLTTKPTRRVDIVFSISYDSNYELARSIILDICNKNELILKDPETVVRMSSHGASGIQLTAKAWVKTADYWEVNYYLLEEVKKQFDQNNIAIPFDQLDVFFKNKDFISKKKEL